MGLWDGIENAEIFDRGNYFKPGFIGVVKILKTLAKETRNSGLAFIVEMEVVESNNPDDPPGKKKTWYQSLVKKDVAFPAVAAWAAACVGYDPSQKEILKAEVFPVLKDLMSAATDSPEKNDFIGLLVRLETEKTITKEKKQDFTRHNFAPYKKAA